MRVQALAKFRFRYRRVFLWNLGLVFFNVAS